jgi:hypothetical protein
VDPQPPQPPLDVPGSPPPAQAGGPAAGHVIGGRYRLVQRIAGGGMASVWEAVDDVLARPVAVKLLHPHLAADEQFVTRFRREAVAAARLAHPSIVSIFDTCSDGATEAIVMELVRGTTLRAELDRRGRFEPAAAASVVAEIADALVAAHAAGIVHRDVKPANVLLSTDGRVLVADFGIAKAIDELELTGAGTTLGTAKYLAPEQVEGKPVDGRTDVYAAGVILYELLAGQPPFTADTEAATALARLHRDPEPLRAANPAVPADLEAIALRALARDPGARIGSASELRDALRAFGRGAPAPAAATAGATGLTDATYVVDATRAAPPAAAVAAPSATPPRPAFPAPARPAHSPAQPSPKRRRWGVAVTLGLVLGAAAVAIVLAIQAGGGGGGAGDDDPGGFSRDDPDAATVTLSAFDPQGDGAENDDLVGAVTDGDLGTAWRSECYRSPAFGNLKDGVGIVIDLGASQDVGGLDVVAAPGGWSAQVFVAEQAADDLAGWGEAAGSVEGAGTDASIDLDGAAGRFVLLFFTGLSDDANGDCQAGNPNAVSVAEIQLG